MEYQVFFYKKLSNSTTWEKVLQDLIDPHCVCQALDHSAPLTSKGGFQHHPRVPRMGQQCNLLGPRTLLALHPGTFLRVLLELYRWVY